MCVFLTFSFENTINSIQLKLHLGIPLNSLKLMHQKFLRNMTGKPVLQEWYIETVGKIFCFPFSSNFCRKGFDTSYEKWISLIWLIVYFQPVAGGLPDIEANENFGYQWCIQPDPWWDHDWALV